MTIKRYFLISGLILVLASGLFMPRLTVNAQEPTPTTDPGAVPDAPYDPIAEATWQAKDKQFAEELSQISIFDFRVAYLIAEGAVVDDSLVSAPTFEQVFGAQSFHTWADFVEQDDIEPFHIVMIHGSLYAEVDTIRTQTAYRNNIILVGISMSFDHLVELTGDRCQNPRFLAPQLERYEDDWVYFDYIYLFEDESYREKVTEKALHLCEGISGEDFGGQSGGIQQGASSSFITHPRDLDALVNSLQLTIYQYGLHDTNP